MGDMNTGQVNLCAILHTVTVQDGQVIFEEKSGFFGCYSRFALERPREMEGHGGPGTWKLVDVDNTFDRGVSMRRLMQAFEYAKERFGKDFEPHKNELA